MENDIDIVEDAYLGERKAVDGVLPGEKESVGSGLDGSKYSDDHEVHEKAVEAETIADGSENIKVTEGRSVGTVETLETSEGNYDVLSEIPNAEDVGSTTELVLSEDNHEEEQNSTESRDKNDALMDDSNAENKRSQGEEVADSSTTAGNTDNLTYNSGTLEGSNQKPERSVSNNMSYLEALTSGEAEVVDGVTAEEPIQKMQDAVEQTESSTSQMEKLETERFEVIEIQDISSQVNGGDIHSDVPENGTLEHVTSVGSFSHEDVMGFGADSLKEQIHESKLGIEDEDSAEGWELNPKLESKSIEVTLHKNEENARIGSEHQQEKHESISKNFISKSEEDHKGEHDDKLYDSSSIPNDDENTGLMASDSEVALVEKVDTQDADEEKFRGSAASDTYLIHHTKENSGVDTSLLPTAIDSTLSQEVIAEANHCAGPSGLSAESSSSSQPQLVNGCSDVSTPEVEIPVRERARDEENETHSSLPGNSPISDLDPTHSSSPDRNAVVKKPVPQVIATNVEPEAKPAAGISSSSKSVNPLPAGAKHKNPLPEPASNNKESVSRLNTDVPTIGNDAVAPVRPAGLGRAAPLLEPTSRAAQQPRVNGAVSGSQNQLIEDPSNGEAEEYDETREKLQMIRVKFLRLAHRLGQTPHNVVVAQVLYRLGLAEQLHGRGGGRVAAFSFDRASAMAEQLEASGQEPLDFTCTIMVIGKSGVGKSATINSIFDEAMFGTDAFELGTKKVQDIVGTVQGIRVRVIDTPGLLPSWSDQRQNEKILHSVKKFIKRTPPDIVLYLDRLDMQSRDFGDMPLLQTITEIFGPSIWFNAIVVLTHAASAPPEGPNGTATSYDMFVTQRSHVVQQAIRQAAGDMRLMNPVSLVENHSACRTNRAGQRVLPNGQVWKPHLLLLSFASKILAEANTLLKLQDTPPGRASVPRTRSPPLPFLLSSLLQSRLMVKLPSEQFGDDDDGIDDDLDEGSDSEEDTELDELPPFKSLTKAQLDKLTKVQRKAYYDELDYREKLFMKKQLKEERNRRKTLKKMQEAAKDLPAGYGDNGEEETGAAASVPVPMPDLVLPTSFDSDNPTHRYRSLDSSNPWLVRAVLEPNGWDHDIGYDGINVERLFVAKEKVPISCSGQISKDKKDANLQIEIASTVKHGSGKATSLGFDMQSVGKDYAYTLRSETRFSNRKINKATVGLSATVLGDVLTSGIKLEDKLIIGKRGQLVVSGGAIYGRGEVAYGGSLEATLRDKDHPLGRFLSTLGLSVMDWHCDLAIGCNSQTQIPVGRHTNLIGRLNINNRGSGQLSVRLNSSEQLQIVLVGLVPLVKRMLKILNKCGMDNDEN